MSLYPIRGWVHISGYCIYDRIVETYLNFKQMKKDYVIDKTYEDIFLPISRCKY